MSLQNEEIESYMANGALPDGSEVAYLSAPGADFSHSLHAHCSFELSNLTLADFRGAKFKNCVFHQVDLTGAIMEGAEFSGCEFVGCNLSQISAMEAKFTGSVFRASDLKDAYLESATFRDSTLEACTLSSLSNQTVAAGALFDRVSFRSCTLDSLDADAAHFLACKFDAVSMRGSILSGANIYLSVLESVDLSGSFMDASTVEDSLISGNLHGVNLEVALVKNSDLSDATGEALANTETEVIESVVSPHFTLKEETK